MGEWVACGMRNNQYRKKSKMLSEMQFRKTDKGSKACAVCCSASTVLLLLLLWIFCSCWQRQTANAIIICSRSCHSKRGPYHRRPATQTLEPNCWNISIGIAAQNSSYVQRTNHMKNRPYYWFQSKVILRNRLHQFFVMPAATEAWHRVAESMWMDKGNRPMKRMRKSGLKSPIKLPAFFLCRIFQWVAYFLTCTGLMSAHRCYLCSSLCDIDALWFLSLWIIRLLFWYDCHVVIGWVWLNLHTSILYRGGHRRSEFRNGFHLHIDFLLIGLLLPLNAVVYLGEQREHAKKRSHSTSKNKLLHRNRNWTLLAHCRNTNTNIVHTFVYVECLLLLPSFYEFTANIIVARKLPSIDCLSFICSYICVSVLHFQM